MRPLHRWVVLSTLLLVAAVATLVLVLNRHSGSSSPRAPATRPGATVGAPSPSSATTLPTQGGAAGGSGTLP